MDQLIRFYKRVKSPSSTGDGCVSPNRPIILLFFFSFFYIYFLLEKVSKPLKKKNTHKFKGFFFSFSSRSKPLSNATWVLWAGFLVF